jgi:hypothetical protein
MLEIDLPALTGVPSMPANLRRRWATGLWGLKCRKLARDFSLAPFLLAWIFSGVLSMDDGSLFGHSDALFRTLHKLDFEPLASRPRLRASASSRSVCSALPSASPA